MVFLLAITVGALVWLLTYPWQGGMSYRQVEQVLSGSSDDGCGGRWTMHVLKRLRFEPNPESPLARDLILTGSPMALPDLYVYKAGGVLAGLLLGILLLVGGEVLLGGFVLLIGALMWGIPDARIKGEAKRTRAKVQHRLPAFLQSLAMMTEAGMNLQPAIRAYLGQDTTALGRELERAMQEVNLGTPLADALLRMANRCQVDDLYRAVASLAQANERGAAGLADTCRTLASEAWARRRDAARELGQQASTKMTLPLILLVLPTIFLFMLGPAVFTMMHNF